MNPKLKDFVGKHYPDSKSDLFAVFMEKGLIFILLMERVKQRRQKCLKKL